MESLQQQINTLTQKVDLVYEVLDRLYHNVSENLDGQTISNEDSSIDRARNRSITSMRRNSDAKYYRHGYTDLAKGNNYHHEASDLAIAQQDVLIDSSGVEVTHHQIKEQDLSPQVQIQRLTAQLTAAYNRIAALEEQLLAKRWK
jgi:hypothetical protein